MQSGFDLECVGFGFWGCFGKDIFNINLLGLGEVILQLLGLSNPVFIHMEKVSVFWALQRKYLGPPHDYKQYFQQPQAFTVVRLDWEWRRNPRKRWCLIL